MSFHRLSLIAACWVVAASAAASASVRPIVPVPADAHAAFSYQYLPLPDSRFVPINVVAASDGSLWIDAQARVPCGPSRICDVRRFGRVAGGQITLWSFPSEGGYQSVSAGPQGTAWLVSGTYLYVFDATGTLVAKYAVPTASYTLTAPALGSDGRMWLTDFEGGLFAVTSSGNVTTYSCPGFCGAVTAGRGGMMWGGGLDKSYQGFVFSATTNGVVHEYGGGGENVITGPGSHLESLVSMYQLDSINAHEQFVPLANLQSLGLDQVVAFSASQSGIWFVGTKNNEAQAIAGTVSLKGTVRSEPFANVPCNETWVYFSALTQGSDGAMYGGYGCGDKTGTHAGFLARVAPKG